MASRTANGHCLWINTLSAKHIGYQSLLNTVNISPNSSCIWKGIMATKKIIHKGAYFSITKDSNTLIWNDPWIPSIDGFKPDMPLSPSSPCLNLVKSLILDNTNSWKSTLLAELFPTQVVKEIKKIMISPNYHPKSLFWSPSKSGIFSTKSAYRLIMLIVSPKEITFISPGSSFGVQIFTIDTSS